MSDPTASDEHTQEETNGTGAALEAVTMAAQPNGASAAHEHDRVPRREKARRGNAREISAFGTIPEHTTAWGMKRETRAGAWEELAWGEESIQRREWPLAELSDETVLSRWGAGTYRTQWFRPGPGGGRKFICQGSIVTYREPARVERAAPAPDPLAQHLEFMRMVRGEANGQISQTLELARVLTAQGSGGGISASEMLAMMREERAAAAAALQQALDAQAAATAAQLQALEARLQASEEEDESALEAAASAALGKKRKAGGFLGFLAAAAEHKDLIKEALPLVIGALSTVNEGLRTTQAAAAASVAARQQQQARPRAEPRGQVVDVELEETELQREQRENYDRATAPVSKPAPRNPPPSEAPAEA